MPESAAVRIDRIELEQFRVYQDIAIDIPPEGLRIVGPNGTGKTTILEAVELLSTTRPRPGANDSDLIAYESGRDLGVAPYARAVGSVSRGDVNVRLEVFIERSERRASTKKLYRVADRPRRAGDVVGLVPTVSFSPDDLDLVLGSPSGRRRFLDVLLSQVDRRYLRHLSRYAKILSQRNGLLRQIGAGDARADDELAYWDEQLVALGAYIVAARVIAVAGIRSFARQAFELLTESSGRVDLRYESTIDLGGSQEQSDSSDVISLAQQLGSKFEQQLRRGRPSEFIRGSTLVGPHRDDLVVSLNDRPLARFGSRGQQRLAVLAAKLAELKYAETVLEVRPVLLLDDILSELDPAHRAGLLAAVAGHGQVLISATEPDLLDTVHLSGLRVLRLEGPGIVSHVG